jgi:hypothetical protein
MLGEMLNMYYQHLLNVDLALQSLNHLTVTRAVRYLTHVFKIGNIEIGIAGGRASPVEVATDPFLSGRLASRVQIQFWGGPPGERGFYNGSVLTMLIDKLFQCIVSGERASVEEFLEVLNGSGRNKAHETATCTASST